MLLSGARLDPSAIAAAALAETSDGGLVAWWVGEEVTLLECDADLFALVTGALPDAALDAPRTFAPTGAIVTSAWLEVGPEGLTYPTQFVRGGGWSKTETLAWDEVGRVTVVDQGFVLVRRRDEELVNTGATVDSKLAPIVSASVARAGRTFRGRAPGRSRRRDRAPLRRGVGRAVPRRPRHKRRAPARPPRARRRRVARPRGRRPRAPRRAPERRRVVRPPRPLEREAPVSDCRLKVVGVRKVTGYFPQVREALLCYMTVTASVC